MAAPDFPKSLMFDELGTLKPGVIDIGHDHYVKRFLRHGDETDTVVGFHVLHPKGPNPTSSFAESPWCMGAITLDVPAAAGLTGARWTLESMDPLSVSPSLLCICGDHGFIRDGRWVVA